MDRSAELLSAIRQRPIAGVTCRGKRDGGGAQIQAIMSAQVFAHEAGIRYFHTPLAKVAHAPFFKLFRRAWARRWEASFGLGQGRDPVPKGAPIVPVSGFLDGAGPACPIVEAPHFHAVCDERPDRYLPLLDDFRSRCRLVRASAPDAYAAVHIRRGDAATPGSPAARRLTPMETVARSVSLIQKTWPELPVHVYSQGRPQDFAGLPSNCALHLNGDVFEALAGLINASVLVTAKSSFSYVAALLSRGIVLYEPYIHKPLSAWTVLAPDGTFAPTSRAGDGLSRAMTARS